MNNQPLVYMPPTDPRAKDIAPAFLRSTELKEELKQDRASATATSGSIYFPPIPGNILVDPPAELQKLLPALSDIEIYQEIIDNTVVPPVVTLVFRVKNSTTYPVVGLKGRVEKII